jgi:predicted RNase H-like nuclease (RuvC/YqgF family)
VPRRSSRSHAAKRSSLASLSKLVVGSHSEKSKLSCEIKAPGDEVEKLKKKGNRISRLMHFWKSREKDKHKATGD